MLLKKRFISVLVGSSNIQAVELTSNKKKVSKIISLDLPEGLVLPTGISNIDTFTQILEAIWKKLGTKEKNIEIIIPELSTQVKSFELPHLDDNDIDEAIRWRMMDFLPDELSEFVLDWEIIEKGDFGIKVMSVVVRKKVLESYILGFEKAGLLPLLVTTPSTVFFDRFKNDNYCRLVLFANSTDTLIALGRGRTIIASSVVSSSAPAEVSRAVSRMVKYYSDVKIDKVLVGGNPLPEILTVAKELASLREDFNPPEVSGLTKEQINIYMVPVLSQLKEATDPSDAATINLLPLELAGKYAAKRNALRIWSLSLLVTLVVWFTFMSTIIVYFYLGSRAIPRNGVVPVNDNVNQTEIINQVKTVNSISQKVIKIIGSTPSPEAILNDIYKSRPEGIVLTEYYLDLESGDIRLLGTSQSRINLIDFKYKLEENSNFSLVSVPVSNFENDSNFEFEMNFSYLPLKSTKPVTRGSK